MSRAPLTFSLLSAREPTAPGPAALTGSLARSRRPSASVALGFCVALGLCLTLVACGNSTGGADAGSLDATAKTDTLHISDAADAATDAATDAAMVDGGPPTAAEVVVHPTELTTAFRNPEKGWLGYSFEPLTAPASVELSPIVGTVYTNYISWGDIEQSEGVYSWHLIDTLLAAHPKRTIKLAIVLLDPTSRPWCGALGHGQTPVWLSNRLFPGAGRWVTQIEGLAVATRPEFIAACGGGAPAVFEPHYWDARFLDAHGKFIWALARRYFYNDAQTAGYAGAPDWSARISSVELATYGAWGEWHSDISWPSAAVKRSTLNTMILHYHQAFSSYAAAAKKDAPLLEQSTVGSTLGAANDIYAAQDPSQVYFSVHQAPTLYGTRSAMTRKFLGAQPSLFFHPDEQTIVSTHVSSSPFRLEWGSCSGHVTQAAFACLGGTPETVPAAVDRALDLHAATIGWWRNWAEDGYPLTSLKPGTQESVQDYFQKRAGYRFYVSEFRFPNLLERGKTFTIAQTWQQRGLGKLYRKAYLRAYLVRGTTVVALDVSDALSAHNWSLGPKQDKLVAASFEVPAATPTGWYELRFAVVDRAGNPAINLAISGKDIADPNDYGRYVLGNVYVK